MTTKVLLVSNDAYSTRRLMAAPAHAAVYQLMVAATRAEAMFHLRTDKISVLAADQSGLDGEAVALLEQAAREHPAVPRLYLACDIDLPTAIRLVNRANVFRLLAKPTHIDDFSLAVQAALHAQVAQSINRQMVPQELPPEMVEPEPASVLLSPRVVLASDEARKLSRREREILLAIVEGRKPADIAQLFFISVHTARNHIKALYRKLSVHSQVELIAKVLKTDSRVRRHAG